MQPGTGSVKKSLLEGVLAARVDNRAEVKAFLSSRRAKITPQRAGLGAR